MMSNKNLGPIVAELFITKQKLTISTVSTTQSYFQVSKDVGLNSAHYFIMKIPNKQLEQIAFNHSSDIDFEDLMNL